MPSALVGFYSGGMALVGSGNPYSGSWSPYAKVELKNAWNSSGPAYVGVLLGPTSGGVTMTSGGSQSSGGLADGFELPPNGSYELTRLVVSGNLDKVRVFCDPAVSGRVRLFWDPV